MSCRTFARASHIPIHRCELDTEPHIHPTSLQNMARPPSSLPPTADAPLKVSLLLGSFVHDPAKFDLFDLYIPASQPAPQHPDEPSFHLLPEIEHTFRPEQKLPPRFISAVFSVLVLSPWLVLISLVGGPSHPFHRHLSLILTSSGPKFALVSRIYFHPISCRSPCFSEPLKVFCFGTGLI